MDKETHCSGCRDNFYNGNNPLEIEKCWHLKNAKLVVKDVYFSIHQIKPTRVKTLDCFSPQR